MNEHTGTQKGTDIYPDVVHVNIGGLKRTGGACVLNSSSVNRLHGSNWLDGFLALSVLKKFNHPRTHTPRFHVGLSRTVEESAPSTERVAMELRSIGHWFQVTGSYEWDGLEA